MKREQKDTGLLIFNLFIFGQVPTYIKTI